MNKFNLGLDLTLVPARVLEKVVNLKQPLSVLNDYEGLQGILTTDDLYFYRSINMSLDKYVPEEILNAFGHGNVRNADEVFGKIDDSASKAYMTTVPQSSEALLHLLANCENNKEKQSDHISRNNYVLQYFSIDEDTIGAVFIISDKPEADTYRFYRNLLSIIYDDYLMQQTDQGIFRNKDERARVLSESGLLTYYCNILNHQ